jgi:hypothetical protein
MEPTHSRISLRVISWRIVLVSVKLVSDHLVGRFCVPVANSCLVSSLETFQLCRLLGVMGVLFTLLLVVPHFPGDEPDLSDELGEPECAGAFLASTGR